MYAALTLHTTVHPINNSAISAAILLVHDYNNADHADIVLNNLLCEYCDSFVVHISQNIHYICRSPYFTLIMDLHHIISHDPITKPFNDNWTHLSQSNNAIRTAAILLAVVKVLTVFFNYCLPSAHHGRMQQRV